MVLIEGKSSMIRKHVKQSGVKRTETDLGIKCNKLYLKWEIKGLQKML